MRECRTTDDRLFAFVDGIETDLEAHVETCEYCQEFLAELWIGELPTDLSDSVLRRIRFDEFLRDLGQMTIDVAGAMAKALVAYGPGLDESSLLGLDDDGTERGAGSPATEDDEE